MINKDNFVQLDVPVLYKIFTIKHPLDDISLQFWDHLLDLYEIKRGYETPGKQSNVNNKSNKKEIQLLFAKGKDGMLVVWRLQDSSLISQKSIKISYYLTKQITLIKGLTIGGDRLTESYSSMSGKYMDSKDNEVFDILCLGYIDGTLELYEIIVGETSLQLNKLLQIKNNNQEPVTKVGLYESSDFFVCRCHGIYMYPKLIEDLLSKLVSKSKDKINSSESLLKIKELNNSSRLSFTIGNGNLHIYNQLEGIFTFSLPQMQSSGSILDSVKTLEQSPQGDMIIASTDDSLKIIYSESNEIQKIVGFKSFVSSIVLNQLPQEKLIQLWVGDFHGQVHYFLKYKKTNVKHKLSIGENEKKQQQNNNEDENELVMFESQLNKSLKMSENGIKNIIVNKNLLLVLDTQMNILLYDLVRNLQSLTGRSST